MQMHCSFKSAIRKSRIALNTHNNKHHVRFQVLMAASYLFMQGSLIALMMEEVRTSEMSSTSIWLHSSTSQKTILNCNIVSGVVPARILIQLLAISTVFLAVPQIVCWNSAVCSLTNRNSTLISRQELLKYL